MIIDWRSKRHPGQSPRQHPHGGELIAAAFGLDADHAALDVAGRGWFCAGREGRQSQIGSVLRPVVFDHAAVAIDEHRLREPLIGMSVKNAAKNLGFGRLWIGAQRRAEPLGEQRRAHVDLARASVERQIALDPQMLSHERETATIAKATPMKTAGESVAGGPRRRQDEDCARSTASLGRRAHASAKRNAASPLSASSWPHWISVPVCRAYARHRHSQTSPQITLGLPP